MMRAGKFIPFACVMILSAALGTPFEPPARRPGARHADQGATGDRPGAALDVRLVIAVNVSWQLDLNELEVQRSSLLTALESPEVLKAIGSRPLGVSLSVFEWAGEDIHDQLVPWTVIRNEIDAKKGLVRLRARDYKAAQGVSYSSAMAKAQQLFAATDPAARRVLLILSSLEADPRDDVRAARNAIRARGVELAALPMMVRAPWGARGLDRYFLQHLVDDSSMIEPVTDIFRTDEAIGRLLVRIIAR